MTLPVSGKGNLLVAGRDAAELAATYGTPLFVYDVDAIRENIERYRHAFETFSMPRGVVAAGGDPADCNAPHRNAHAVKYQIAYASKALSTTAIYEVMKQERGVSIDVVSGGELYTALNAGVDPSRIHFHGNNKSEAEVRYALQSKVGCFVVDSFHEIDLLQRLTKELFSPASVPCTSACGGGDCQVRRRVVVDVLLRVSPGVTAHTHEHNTTGQVDSKFGFDIPSGQARQAYERITSGSFSSDISQKHPNYHAERSRVNHLRVMGLHCHIGSQIFSTDGHVLACRRLLELAFQWGLLVPATTDAITTGSAAEGGTGRNAGVAEKEVDDKTEKETGEEISPAERFVLNVGGGYGIAYTSEDKPLAPSVFIHTLLDTVAAFLREKTTAAFPNAAAEGVACVQHEVPLHTTDFRFPEIWIEPGRSLVGAAGTTLYTVGASKTIPALHKRYIAIDGGMSDNIRPVLYQAKYTALVANRMSEHHRFLQLSPTQQQHELQGNLSSMHDSSGDGATCEAGEKDEPAGMMPCTVVGKLCETGDQLIKDCPLPRATRSGDVLAVLCTGAYGYAMASNYNRIPRPAILFVDGGAAVPSSSPSTFPVVPGAGEGADAALKPRRERIVVRRETYEDLVRNDVSWAKESARTHPHM